MCHEICQERFRLSQWHTRPEGCKEGRRGRNPWDFPAGRAKRKVRAGEDGIHRTFPQAGPKGGWVFRCGETPFSGIKSHFTERDGREGGLAYISPRGSLAPLPALGLHLDLQPAHALCPLTGIGLVGRCVTSSHRAA